MRFVFKEYFQSFVVLFLVILSVCAFSARVEASIVTFELSGELDTASDVLGLFPGVSAGDPFSWRISYDTNMTDIQSQVDWGQYNSLATYTLMLGTTAIDTSSFSTSMNVWNNMPLGSDTLDGYRFTAGRSASSINRSIDVKMQSTDLTVLNNDRPPENLMDVSDADYANEFRLSYLSMDPAFHHYHSSTFTGSISSIRKIPPSTVPEPATILLFSTGVLGLGLRRKRKA